MENHEKELVTNITSLKNKIQDEENAFKIKLLTLLNEGIKQRLENKKIYTDYDFSIVVYPYSNKICLDGNGDCLRFDKTSRILLDYCQKSNLDFNYTYSNRNFDIHKNSLWPEHDLFSEVFGRNVYFKIKDEK